jgi:glycosyltransferase involved in cell wall biosynthesis
MTETRTVSRPVLADASDGGDALRVLLVTESSYPYRVGGVSTWCESLVTGLTGVNFRILALIGEADATPIYPIPKSVSELIPIPLWGTREALEHQRDLGARELRRVRRANYDDVVTRDLAPEIGAFVASLFAEAPDPVDVAQHIAALYRFFLASDFDRTMRSATIWSAFLSAASDSYPAAAQRAGYEGAPLGLSDVVTGLHWLCHWLLPIARPLPDVDIVHTTMAGACTLPAVAMKLENGCGFIFSEHGIYLRETYLREAPDNGSLFLKLFKVGFARRMSEVSYVMADEVATCCDYNKRWEVRSGSTLERVSTVYYGLEPSSFVPSERVATATPVVTWVGRIDPVKDLETLLRAAAIVRAIHPAVVFRLHGAAAAGAGAYLERLLALRHELGLDDTVEMSGYTSDPQGAYDSADFVVLSSISEGFPYATLEAMLCAKPVIATDVGGISEQLGECGVLVEPGDPSAMAHALLELFDDPDRARELGQAARRRAEELFNNERFEHRYGELYRNVQSSTSVAPNTGSFEQRASHSTLAVPNSPALDDLVGRIRATVPHPVDELEIAAVIEAGGVNDDVAQQRFGAVDVFAVGQAILQRLRSSDEAAALRPHDVVHADRGAQTGLNFARGLTLLFPAVAVLLVAHLFANASWWTLDTGRALMLGVTTSMILTNGFLYSVVRRSSLYLGCGRRDAARKFLSRSSGVAILGLAALGEIGVLLASMADLRGIVLTTFALSYSSVAIFWIASGALMVLDRSYETGIAVLIGSGAGLLSDHLLPAGSPRLLQSAVLIGFVVTMAVLILRVLAIWPYQSAPTDYRPPGAAYIFAESFPYFCFGGLLIALILGPIVLTTFLGTTASTSASDLTSIQVGMTLALVPIMLSLYAADAGLRRFWSAASRALSNTAAPDTAGFANQLVATHRSVRSRYLLGVVVLSLLSIPGLWALAHTDSLHVFGVRSTNLVEVAFVVSVCAYGLVASGIFESALALSFGRPGYALWSLVSGVLASTAVAAALFALDDFEVGFASLFLGAAVFAVAGAVRNRRFLRNLVNHYVRSM